MTLYRNSIPSQRGAVLIIGLVMLLLLTMIGLASIRGSDMQERMAGNMRDRNLAFQAAEAALRVAEDELSVMSALPTLDGSEGYWPDLNKSSTLAARPTSWTVEAWDENSIRLEDDTIGGIFKQPQYAVEQVEINVKFANQGGAVDVESMEKMEGAEYYRITSRGLGGTEHAEVILQSTFIR